MAVEIENFIAELHQSLTDGTFIKLTLSNYKGAEPQLQRVSVRPVDLKKGPRLMFQYRFQTRDTVKNLDTDEALAEVSRLLDSGFKSGHLFTVNGDIQLTVGKKSSRLVKGRPSMDASPARPHDREKKTIVDPYSSYLKALGITTESRKLSLRSGPSVERSEAVIRPDQRDKWKQINKFIEVVSGLIRNSTLHHKPELNIVDMGSGKGYLTFALYDFLSRGAEARSSPPYEGGVAEALRGRGGSPSTEVTGIEQRPGLVSLCNDLAKSCGFDGLQFQQGSIADSEIEDVDILIALHACDTATDDALYKGIRAGAEIIVAAPCCHHEVKKQLKPPELLAPIMKHPVMHERISETITDGIRSMLLEAHGYKTKMFEFIATEHTPKNNLLVATRVGSPQIRKGSNNEKAKSIDALRSEFGIDRQRLYDLLHNEE